MATFSLGNVPSPIAQAMRLAQLREAQNPNLAMERQIQQAAQLQQLQQQSPEAQLALQLRQAQLNSALQQQAFQQQQQPLLLKQLEAQLQGLQNPNIALEKDFNEQLMKSSFNPLSGVRRVGVGAAPVGEIEPIFNPVTGAETPFVRDFEMRKSNLAKSADPEKPIEVNGRLLKRNPTTGGYDVVFDASTPAKSPFTQQTVVSLTDPSDVRQAIPDADGRPPAGYQFAKAIDASKTAGTYTKQQLSSVNSLSDRFQKNDYVKKAVFAQNSIDIILQGLAQNNSTGDIAAINQFQAGMVDPGATVREGDVKLITNSAPLLARAQNYLPRLIKGSVLPPEMRSEMRKISIDIYNMRAKNANEIAVTRFTNNAKKAGIQFEDIGQEFGQLDQTGAAISNAPAPAATTSVEDFLNNHDL